MRATTTATTPTPMATPTTTSTRAQRKRGSIPSAIPARTGSNVYPRILENRVKIGKESKQNKPLTSPNRKPNFLQKNAWPKKYGHNFPFQRLFEATTAIMSTTTPTTTLL